MNKTITSLALATVLGAGFAAGAQAQTVLGNGTPYSLNVSPTVTGSTGNFLYSYAVTLTSNPFNTDITSFNINNVLGYLPNSANAVDVVRADGTASDFASGISTKTNAINGLTQIQFSATNSGFQTVGDNIGFNYRSSLPPTGNVSLSTNGQGGTSPNPNLAGTGSTLGPGANVPEISSFALLGLGLLPLGLIARKRIARN